MVAERFDIMNEKEEILHGVIETENPRKKQPVVVFLNGFLDTMDTPVKKKLATSFLKDGFVTVRFDPTYGFGSGSGDESKYTLTGEARDADRVIDYAIRRGYVNPDKVVIFGHCFGAMAAILHSAFDDRVKAVISVSCPYDFHDTRVTRMAEHEMARIRLKRYFHLFSDALGKEVRIDYSFFEDGMKKDMPRAVRNLKQATLIIHGLKDESIPLANAEEIHHRTPGKKELHVLPEMGHQPTVKDAKTIYDVTRAFLKKHLKV